VQVEPSGRMGKYLSKDQKAPVEGNAASWVIHSYVIGPGWRASGGNGENNESQNESWRAATSSNEVSYGLAYYNSSGDRDKYQYAPYDDNSLRSEKGYWVYAQEAGTVKMNVAGASDSNETYLISDLMVRNENSGEVKKFDTAAGVGWSDSVLRTYRDGSGSNYVDSYGCTSDPEVCSYDRLLPWDGYFIKSLRENLTLLRYD
jgi:hypothetical protein